MDLYTLLLLAFTSFVLVVIKTWLSSPKVKPVAQVQENSRRSVNVEDDREVLHIVYATQKGTAKQFATQLAQEGEKYPEVKVL